MIDDEIKPRLEKLGGERAQYLEFTSLSNDLEGLQRFCQAYDLYRAMQAQKKCRQDIAGDESLKEELLDTVKQAKEDEKTCSAALTKVLSKKEKQGTVRAAKQPRGGRDEIRTKSIRDLTSE